MLDASAGSRAIGVNVKTVAGTQKDIRFYEDSHTLLIGASDYHNGWSLLESVAREMGQLEEALTANGFSVTRVDNPDSRQLEPADREFDRKGLPMTQVLTWARDIEANHALFMFDSCFSRTIFKQKSRATAPSWISEVAAQPVR